MPFWSKKKLSLKDISGPTDGRTIDSAFNTDGGLAEGFDASTMKNQEEPIHPTEHTHSSRALGKNFDDLHHDHHASSDWKTTLILMYSAVGTVFGDLGTSILYVFSVTFQSVGAAEVNDLEILGVMSLVFWTFTLIVIVEYILIVLRADDNGQGGTIALYALLCRYGNLGETKQEARDFTISAYTTNSKYPGPNAKGPPQWLKTMLLSVVALGVGFLLGDGVLTPAISVLSAVEGLLVVAPAIAPGVVPITIVILLILFLVQSFGTQKIGAAFSPVIILWLSFNAGIGIYNITFYPAVFKALSPSYAFEYFIAYGYNSWVSLGSVMLAITGAEACFADIQHFSRLSIQLATVCFVYPCLMLTYLGQAAVLLTNPAAVQNPFWESIPGPMFWPIFILSILATIVASQALITASFSIVQQCMALNMFPSVTIKHTSANHYGQIYSPEVNYILMVVVIIVVAAFQNSNALASAYGLAVCVDIFLTTTLVSFVMRLVWGLPIIVPIIFFAFFGLIVGSFLSSNLLKIPRGGWLPLAIGVIMASTMLTWHYGKKACGKAKYRFKRPYNDIFSVLAIAEDDEKEEDLHDDLDADSVEVKVEGNSTALEPMSSTKKRRLSVFDVGYGVSGVAHPERRSFESDFHGYPMQVARPSSTWNNPTSPTSPSSVTNSPLPIVAPLASTPTSEVSPLGMLETAPVGILATTTQEPSSGVSFAPPSGITFAPAPEIPSVSFTNATIPREGPKDEDPTQYRGIMGPPGNFSRSVTIDSVWSVGTSGNRVKVVGRPTSIQGASLQGIHDGFEGLDTEVELPRFPGLGLYYTENTSGIPGVFCHWVNCVGVIPQATIFITIRHTTVARVPKDERMYVMKSFLEGFWRVVVTLGYMDRSDDARDMIDDIVETISKVENRFVPRSSNPDDINIDTMGSNTVGSTTVWQGAPSYDPHNPTTLPNRSTTVVEAVQNGQVYFVGRKIIDAKEGSNIFHKMLVGLFKGLQTISRDNIQVLKVPDDRLIEVGLKVRI